MWRAYHRAWKLIDASCCQGWVILLVSMWQFRWGEFELTLGLDQITIHWVLAVELLPLEKTVGHRQLEKPSIPQPPWNKQSNSRALPITTYGMPTLAYFASKKKSHRGQLCPIPQTWQVTKLELNEWWGGSTFNIYPLPKFLISWWPFPSWRESCHN